MRAGRLRHRVDIETVGTTYDDYGDLSDSWTTLASVWASISPISGREETIASELTGVVTHSILVRYRSGISEQNRIIFDSRVFQIESVRNWNERNIFLEILAKEVTT
jgi:SPP1 family predicted phage head-tail adaptor